MQKTYTTDSDGQTRALGEELARELNPGDVLALTGGLGSGKTCLTQGIGRGLGVSSYITSPTFTIMHQYQGRLPLYHFDLYRISGSNELEDFGFDEFINGPGVCIIEWAEKCMDVLPGTRTHIDLQVTGPAQRQITIDRNIK